MLDKNCDFIHNIGIQFNTNKTGKGGIMITHDNIWDAIDEIARENNVSPSRMAINCGLDATTFNKSKRCDAFGKSRFPSLRTITKVLNEQNMSMADFGAICDRQSHEATE